MKTMSPILSRARMDFLDRENLAGTVNTEGEGGDPLLLRIYVCATTILAQQEPANRGLDGTMPALYVCVFVFLRRGIYKRED